MALLGGGVLGTGPLGVPHGGDYSEPAPLAELLANPLGEWTYLLEATLKRWDTAAEEVIRIGSRAYWTRGTDADPYKLFRAGLVSPYNFRLSVMSGGVLHRGIAGSSGDLEVANPSGEWDSLLRDYSWRGQPLEVYLGDGRPRRGWTFAEFGRIQKGTASRAPRARLDRISIPLEDPAVKLREPVQRNRYKGLGQALRCDGVDDYATVGDYCDAGSGSLFVAWRGRITKTGANQFLQNKRGTYGYRLNFNVSNDLVWNVGLDDGTTMDIRPDGSDYLDGKEHIFVAVIDRDGTGVSLLLYADGELLDSRNYATATGSATDPTAFSWGRATSSVEGDMMEGAVGFRVPTEDEIAEWVNRPLDAAKDGCIRWGLNDGAGSVATAEPAIASDLLTLDGVDDFVEVTGAGWSPLYDPAAPSLSIEMLVEDQGPGTNRYIWSEGSSADPDPLVAVKASGSDPTRLAYSGRDDSGTWFIGLEWADVWTGGLKHVVLTDDGSFVRLYVNGAEHSSGGQSYNLPVGAVTLNRSGVGALLQAGAAVHFPAHVHYVRAWRRVLSPAEVAEHARTHEPSDRTSLALEWKIDERSGSALADSSGNNAGGTITGATWGDIDAAVTGAVWVGSLEGGEELRGRYKPVTVGEIGEVPLILVDKVGQVYQWHDGASSEVLELREKGLPEGSGNGWTILGDTTDLYSVSPAQGEAYTDVSRSLVRFGGAGPKGKATIGVRGDAAGGYVGGRWDLVKRLAVTYAGLEESTEIDAGRFEAAKALDNYTAGAYAGLDEVTVEAMIARVAAPDGVVYFGPQGKLGPWLVQPPEDLSPGRVFGEDDLERGKVEREAVIAPVGRVVVRYAPKVAPWQPGELSDLLSAEQRQTLAQPWSLAEAENRTKRETFGLGTMTVESAVVDPAAADAIAAKLLRIYGTQREVFAIGVPREVFQVFVGDTIGTKYSRFGLDELHNGTAGTRPCSVVGVVFNVASRDVQLVVFT